MIVKPKYFYLYQITNKIDGKIYIGVHKTTNLDDGYMGSGASLNRAYKKYGIEVFEKQILIQFENEKQMFETERIIVDSEFIKRTDVYNRVNGGKGHWPSTIGYAVVKDKNGQRCRIKTTDLGLFEGEFVGINKDKVTVRDHNNNYFSVYRNDPRYISGELIPTWKGKNHSDNTKRIIGEKTSIHQKGKGNSQYGKCWICNDVLKRSMSIKKELLDQYIKDGWVLGRKLKF